ncbi:MAG: ATP cone domain-containing protein, partial [Actinobacteria bacterium]|nr:ATP cone domain-containing protein [Actinomycetota bacterium]
ECVACGERFTTFERLGDLPLTVTKRDESREPFDRDKVVSGMSSACKNRPITAEQIAELAGEVEETLRAESSVVTSEMVGLTVLEALRKLDDVAYLRFASVYKGFEEIGDFQREVGLLKKVTAPKQRER